MSTREADLTTEGEPVPRFSLVTKLQIKKAVTTFENKLKSPGTAPAFRFFRHSLRL